MEQPARQPLARLLALNRAVLVVLISVLFFGLGEQLWQPFLPIYLRAQTRELAHQATDQTVAWGTLLLVGLFACLRNLFEGFCYIGGGQLTARLGDRGSLLLFGSLTVASYALFHEMTDWPVATILAALLILGWEPLSVPVTFTTVGSTVEPARRGLAFALQSIQKRLPKIIAPPVAGFMLDLGVRRVGDPELGRMLGMNLLVSTALGLAVVALLIQFCYMPHHPKPPPGPPAREVLRLFPSELRRLLLAEVFTRWCDWLVREFVVLYVVVVRGWSATDAGLLMSLQNITALLTYLPIGSLTGRVGLRPFVGVTFVFFALFPLTLALTPVVGWDGWLAVAFVVYGLREIGEPARKALITTSLPEEVRARGVGLYWGLRSFAVCSASLAGAVLWFWFGPEVLLLVAFVLGCVGAGVFYLWHSATVRAEPGY